MSSKTNTSRVVIIAAIDQTATSDSVIHTATSLANVITGAELHFLHVVDPLLPPSASTARAISEVLAEGRVFLDEIVRTATERFTGRLAGHLSAGDPSRLILQLASDLEADLIIVGSHGKKALARLMLGSVSENVAKKAQCAVLVAREKEYAQVPEIEPACPQCLEVQVASEGEKLWCERHQTRHVHGHLHYETPESYGVGAMFIRP